MCARACVHACLCRTMQKAIVTKNIFSLFLRFCLLQDLNILSLSYQKKKEKEAVVEVVEMVGEEGKKRRKKKCQSWSCCLSRTPPSTNPGLEKSRQRQCQRLL